MGSAPKHQSVELLVIQPTPFCNIDCSYCYLPERSSRKRMSLECVELLGKRVLGGGWAANEITAIWHAGEPLVVPPAWYVEAFAALARHCPGAVRLAHAMQTNGTLIDDSWAAFFKRHVVRVGVSLDGPRELHDSRRKTRTGKGTFDRTLDGIRTLQAAGVPFHVITVLTADSLRRPDELFDFYVARGIDQVCFNVEEIEGINKGSSLSAAGVEHAFRAFLSRFLERTATSGKPMWVREIAASVATILASAGRPIPNQQVEPLAILNVDVDGNLSTFSPELLGTKSSEFGDFRFVNLRDGGPGDLLASPAFQRAEAAISAGVEACRKSCAWFQWCGGGAPANKLFENGSIASTETLYCRLTKQSVMAVVLDAIETRKLPGLKRAA